MSGLRYGQLQARLDADMVILCFESGETETVTPADREKAAALYGDMYVRRVTPFAAEKRTEGPSREPVGRGWRCGAEVQLSNTPGAGME